MTAHQMLLFQFFCTNFIILGGTAFVAFFVVRDSLKAARWKVYLGTFAFTLVYTSLSSLFHAVYLQGVSSFVRVLFNIHPLVAIVGGAALYLHFVDAARDKLLFVLLLVAHCSFFCYDLAQTSYWPPGALSAGEVELISLLVSFALFYPLFAWILRRLWLNIKNIENVRWFRLCLLPVMFIALSFLLRVVFAFNIDIQFLHSVVVLVVDICALVTYFMLISALTRTEEKARIEADLRALNDNLSLQANRMDELTTHIEEVKLLRHDLRHHLRTLADMLEARREEEARAYIAQVWRDMPERVMQPLCQNYVADAIVGRYLAAAEKRGISARAVLSISQEPGIGHTDLGIVLGNLMENALEACERQTQGEKYIHIEAKTEQGRLMIRVENSADRVASREGEAFLSSKREGEGLGLRSVTAIAKKYGGFAQFESEAGLFRALVLLYPVAPSPVPKI